MMDINEFWAIIEKIKNSDEPEIEFEEILKQQEPEELISYQMHFDTFHEKAYRWDLWGAAYIMEGGCSDDGFMDFRYGLISKGKEVYEKALRNPDTLAELGSDEVISNESFGYVAQEIYELKTEKEMPRKEFEQPEDPIGEEWDFDDEDINRKRLPKLSEKYA
jgi:uncharacterized protein DUF4240